MAQGAVSPHFKRLSIALAAVPPILHLLFVIQYAQPLPVWEQWNFVKVFELYHSGGNWISFLLTPYNDHLNTFPFLISLLLGLGTHWNILFEIFLGILLLSACFAILVFWLRRLGPALMYTLLPIFSVFWFSLRSYEIILNGFNISVHYVSALLVLLAIEFLSRSSRSACSLVVAIVMATLLSFSWGGGLLIWPTGLLLLVIESRDRIGFLKSGVWLGAAVVCAGLIREYRVMPDYFSDFRAAEISRFAFALLANPISERPGWIFGALILGSLLLITRAAFAGRILKPGSATRIWAGWGLYHLLNILAISLTRFRGGVEKALPSRYSFVVTPLILSIFVLLSVVIYRRAPQSTWRKMPAGVLAVFLLISTALSLVSSFHSSRLVAGWHDELLAPLIKIAKESPDFLSPGMVQELICARWQKPEEGLRIMKKYHLAMYRHPGNKTDETLEELLQSPSPRSPSRIEYSADSWKYDRPSRSFIMTGAVLDRDTGHVPYCLFIKGPGGVREFALTAYPPAPGEPDCPHCGFRIRVPRTFMHQIRHNIRLTILADDGLKRSITFQEKNFAPSAWKKLIRAPRHRKEKIQYSKSRQ